MLFKGLRLFSSITCLWDWIICFMSSIIRYWICKFIYSSMFCSSRIWFFMIISRVSLFYLDLIFFKMSSRIFFVEAIDYMICKLVIYFFNVFLFVESFSVLMTLERSLIWAWIYWFYYHPSFFLSKTIYPCFFLI